ncbi:hypothetical protein [Nocardia barduliensis]|uniref:hypothetical protein n=1 Tax=Nocardia barduliensis TaxID=2736643 RepID=UPI001573904F|nr:hypothetical protein [Nocardia barduliensis]
MRIRIQPNDNTPLSIAVAPADPEPVPFGSAIALDLDLFFHGSAGAVDEDLQDYLDDIRERRLHPIEFDSRGFAPIGSIRLIVSPRAERDPDYACMSFYATTWSMALMFYRSNNLRDIVRRPHRGVRRSVLCMEHRGYGRHPDLLAARQLLDSHDPRGRVPGDANPPRLRQAGRAQVRSDRAVGAEVRRWRSKILAPRMRADGYRCGGRPPPA